MTDLSSLILQVSYRSGKDDLVNDFYIPCLQQAVLYRRAVGYFTSHGLANAALGISHLIANDGEIQLVASPHLTQDDIDSIERGYDDRSDKIIEAVNRSFKEVHHELVTNRLSAMAWMICEGYMDVRLAIRLTDDGRLSDGLYHEKMGVITDSLENHVAFSGSQNETAGGLIDNFEGFDAFWSWEDPQNRVEDKINNFSLLWGDDTHGLEVIPFTDAAKDVLKPYKPSRRPSPSRESGRKERRHRRAIDVPDGIELRSYQSEAINNWIKGNGTGVFKMATGAGKTITALAAATKLFHKLPLKALVVVCPYRHLVTQWADECKSFGMTPILAYKSRKVWEPRLSNELYSINRDLSKYLVVITTNATFGDEPFQSHLKDFPKATMLIADEVHNLGAGHLRTTLPESIPFRLGLSATPERWYDDEGTEAIYEYFGPLREPQLTLKDALEAGVLVPYNYYPILVNLTEDEHEEYLELSAVIGRLMSMNEEGDNKALERLLIKRARLIGTASNKISELRRLILSKDRWDYSLVYCGDGRVDDPTGEDEVRHIEAITKLLGHELDLKVHTYTAETSIDDRKRLSSDLALKRLDALVAIRCLDEGVDIPPVRNAIILASSSNPRQFIQRRGRVLRRSPGKEFADIYDFIVIPPDDIADSDVERNMLRRELTRFVEFADLARNAAYARSCIFELQKRFDLTDI